MNRQSGSRSVPRSQSDHAMYSDAYLDHWGDVFVRFSMYDHGVRFDTFVQDPQQIFAAVLCRKLGPQAKIIAAMLARSEACREYVPADDPRYQESVRRAIEDMVAEFDPVLDALAFRPLLPRQRLAQSTLDQETIRALTFEAESALENLDAVQRDGVFVSPLHHHAHRR